MIQYFKMKLYNSLQEATEYLNEGVDGIEQLDKDIADHQVVTLSPPTHRETVPRSQPLHPHAAALTIVTLR